MQSSTLRTIFLFKNSLYSPLFFFILTVTIVYFSSNLTALIQKKRKPLLRSPLSYWIANLYFSLYFWYRSSIASSVSSMIVLFWENFNQSSLSFIELLILIVIWTFSSSSIFVSGTALTGAGFLSTVPTRVTRPSFSTSLPSGDWVCSFFPPMTIGSSLSAFPHYSPAA